MDQQPFARLQAGLREQGVVGGGEDLGKPAGGGPVQRSGDGHQLAFVHHRQLGLTSSPHDGHDTVTVGEALGARAALGDLAGQLEPGNVGRRPGRGRIPARQLVEVGSVDAGRPHTDQDLAGPRPRVRMLLDSELPVGNNSCSAHLNQAS